MGIVSDYREMLDQMRDEEALNWQTRSTDTVLTADRKPCPGCGTPYGGLHGAVCPERERLRAQVKVEADNVNHPPHYKQGDIECIDAIEAALTEEEFRGYCKGNALKYVWRERHKGQDESLRKAVWYLNRALGE
jgi:hypothetical protein